VSARRHAGAGARGFAVVILLLCAPGCASIPGKTGAEQAVSVEELETKTLADLAKQEPKSAEEIAQCVGYVIMNNKLTKIPLVGVGAGYGVAVDPRADQRTYLRMSRFDLGMGWGARAIRPVMIFHDAEKFRKFIDGDFDLTLGAEASAKVGEKGGAGGGAGESQKKDLGYKSYVITDAGVSATASLAVIRVKRVNLKK
jgi:lipid-binding SYLF domain-containing protein